MFGESRDTNIVEMQFENRQFEREIAKSKKSLEDFKEELDFDGVRKGLERFTSGIETISFARLTDNVQALTDKFTGLGDVGEFVLSRIRNSLEGAAIQMEGFIKSFSLEQMTVGQSKYESLNKAVMAITATGEHTEEEAYEVANRVMAYTDQTSANFMTMVEQLQSFVSYGEGLWDSERAMEGIFNMTAKAGKGAAEASSAMQTFSKAMGAGYVDLQKWGSLNLSAKLVTKDFRKTVLETAAAVGALTEKDGKYYTKATEGTKKTAKASKELEVTTENLESTLASKWFNKKTMMSLFNKYYFENLTASDDELNTFAGVAYKSAQRALTFADAMNAVKESISSGWLETYRTVFGDLTDAMKLFTDLCERVIESLDKIKKSRNDVLKEWASLGGRSTLIEAIMGDFGKDVKTGAYGLLDLFDDVGKVVSDGFWNMLSIFASGSERIGIATEEGYKEAWLAVKLKEFTDNIREFIKSIKTFFTEEVVVGGEVTTRLEMVKNVVDGIVSALALGYMVVSGALHFIGGLIGQLQPAIDSVGHFFSVLGVTIYDSVQSAQDGDVITSFFNQLLEDLKPLTDAINTAVKSVTGMLVAFIEWGKESGFFESVGNVITSVFRTIAKVVSTVGAPLLNFLASLFDIATDLFENGFSEESLKQVGPKFQAALETMVNSIIDAMPESFKGVGEAIKDLFGLWGEDEAEGRDNIFTKIREFFTGGITSLQTFFDQLFGSFTLGAFVKSKLGFSTAYDALNTFAGWFKGVNLYRVIMAFLGVVTVANIFSLVHHATKAVKNIRSFFEDVGGTLKQGFLGEYEYFSERFLNIAKAIALLAGAVMLLGAMNPANLLAGAVAIGALMGAMYLFTKKMSEIKATNMQQIASIANITALTASVGALVIALIPLALMRPDQMMQAVLGLASIMAVLGIFIKVVSDNKLGSIKISGLAGFAIGIGMLVLALVPLSMMRPESMVQAILGLASVMAVLGIFVKVMTDNQLKSAKLAGLTGLAIGIGLLVASLIPLSNMQPMQMMQAILGLASVMAVLGIFVKVMNSNQLSSAKLAGVVGLAFGISVLVLALLPLSAIEWGGLAKMGVGLVVILTSLGLFAKALDSMVAVNGVKLAGLFGLSLGIMIIIQALLPLSDVSWEGLAKIGLGLVVLLTSLALFTKALDSMVAVGGVKVVGLIGLVAGIYILVQALLPLSDVSWEGLGKMGAGLLGILTLLGGFVAVMSLIPTNILKNVGVFIVLLGITAVIIAIGLMLNDVKNIKESQVMAFLGGITLLFIGVSTALLMISSVPLAAGLKGVVLIAAAVGALVGVLALVVPLFLNSVGTSLADFSSKMELIASLLGGFSTKINAVDESGFDKASTIFDKIKNMMGKIVGFAGYSQSINAFSIALFDLSTGLEIFQNHTSGLVDPEGSPAIKMVDRLLSYKEALATFTIGTLSTDLMQLAVGLYAFSTLGAGEAGTEPAALGILKDLADSATNLQALSTVNFESLKSALAGLGGAMMIYASGAKEMTGIEPGQTSDVGGAVSILKAITSAFAEEGGFTIPEIPTEAELGTFGADLAALAGGVVKFVEASKGIGRGTDKAVKLLDFLGGDLKTKLTTQNLDVTKAFQNASISDAVLSSFAGDIVLLGWALSEFVKQTKGLEAGDTKTAEDSLTFFSKLREALVDQDISSAIMMFQDNNIDATVLTRFGKDIEALGGALAAFAKSVTWEKDAKTAFNNAIQALGVLVYLENKMPKIGGVVQWWGGYNKSFTELSGEIEALGTGLRDFSNKLIGENGEPALITTETAKQATGVLDEIVTFMNTLKTKLPSVGGAGNVLKTFFSGRDYTLVDFGNDLGELGSGIGKFGTGIGDKFNGDVATKAIETINAIADIMIAVNGITGGNFDYFKADEYMQTIWTVISMLNGEDGYINPATGEAYGSVAESLVLFMKEISDAINEYGDIDSNSISMFATMAKGLKDFASISPDFDFTTVGMSIASGVAKGITDNTSLVTVAATNMAVAAYNAAMAELNANSPSKVFQDVGGYIAAGLGIGIEDGTGEVKKSAVGMVDAAIKGAMTTIGIIGSLLGDDLNTDPVITPVFDLSQVNAGFTTMNGMFDDNSKRVVDFSAVSRLAYENLPDRTTPEINQNGSDYSGIYNRMNELGEKLTKLGTEIMNMKLVMDTGALVGAVSDGVDTYLGEQEFFAKRGN